ncbi:amino acid permease/ SLC12A domain-containing protein [Aspergillus pseudonomiae]|uniref:Amino acid permease/ SLC12A domain-containing protein n=1 Tax=Aspergillus pseudonomiae TaxID=1506151 RepID=A0A5N6HX69_9EURO|nr:amino acid permease/ SLC12A domain-containing protein [Aspergillus pseudonomiae]KAB8259035.1 amino acid permease/ SLC12A domain-containing protein [Aspergillus pseudonomiae]KAE8406671.1 amino acid permease/ SLC12A domain-containing protein [Aspergillus pseudonomiae]
MEPDLKMKEDPQLVEANVQEGQINSAEGLQRRLENRHVQLIAIGGSIGTALFVTIGNGLAAGGPASLLIAYVLYCGVLACINNCLSEMIVLHPVSGGFIRIAGKWVDDALGFMVGWNFFLYEALMIPFEITAINLILGYWRDDIPVAAVCVACIVLFAAINALAVAAYGEAEFWLSSGKVILIFMLFFFTFITMVGGNPAHDAYGFRYWNDPGPFATHRTTDSLGRFEGFLAAIWSAAFCIVGPEYIAMAAAESRRPRIFVKAAFKTIYWRFVLFFALGALCVGIVIPWNDPTLQAILAGESNEKGGGASPYVIAMSNMKIRILPDIVNALLITSVFSAGNTLTYCATRSLYGLALDGRAPKILSKTKNGVPLYAFGVVMCFPFLSFLQLSDNSSQVLTWLVNLVTAGALIDYLVICITYIQFHRACKAQGIDRQQFPYYGYFQPYCSYLGAVCMVLVLLFYGYTAFAPWNVETFFQNYTMQIIAPILYFGWKFAHRTKILKPQEVDLVWDRPIVDSYEATFTSPAPGFWAEMIQMFRFKRPQAEPVNV